MHAYAVGARHRGRQLEVHGIEPVRIVVHANVLDGVFGLCAVSARHAEVVDLATWPGRAGGVDDLVTGDVAGESELHAIREPQQLGLGVGRRATEGAIRFHVQAGGEALVTART